MPFQIVHNDITKMNTDAIVNAANSRLAEGGGVCGAIFAAAGSHQLAKACSKLAPCPVGNAVITKGFELAAGYVIHAVGPVWQGGDHGEPKLLYDAYMNSLKLAQKHRCRSIAFPLISSGIYGYPKDLAMKQALSAFADFLDNEDMDIYLVVFDRKAVQLGEELGEKIIHYIDTYFEPEKDRRRTRYDGICSAPMVLREEKASPCPQIVQENCAGPMEKPQTAALKPLRPVRQRKLEELLNNMEETFSEMLLRLIDEKGYDDVMIYKRANMDRKLFSKIRKQKDYHPKKQTVLALAVALRLSLDEALDLLETAGYSLSSSCKADVIIRYFLENKEYDMFEINKTLFYFEQPLLG